MLSGQPLIIKRSTYGNFGTRHLPSKAFEVYLQYSLSAKAASLTQFNNWINFQLWKQEALFVGGCCDLIGEWPQRNVSFIAEQTRVREDVRLGKSLSLIPSCYALFIRKNWENEHLISSVILPYLFHYRGSYCPPPLFVAANIGVLSADLDVSPFSINGDPGSGLIVELGSTMSGYFTMSEPRHRSDPSGPTAGLVSFVLYRRHLG